MPPPPAILPHREHRDASGTHDAEEVAQYVGGPREVVHHFAHEQDVDRFGWTPCVKIALNPRDGRAEGRSRLVSASVLQYRAPRDIERGGGEIDAGVAADLKTPDMAKKLSGAAPNVEDTRPLAVMQGDRRRHGETM